MIEDIFKLAISDGILAALFSFLLFYVLRDSSRREKKYQDTIFKLTKHLDALQEIKQEIGAIKELVNKKTKAKAKEKTDAK